MQSMLRIGIAGSAIEGTGTTIGRYKLLRPLGEGGFGSVWHAEQSEPIRRDVALKVIKPGMDSREIIARFEAERQALALMDHPNIAAVLDAGTTDEGRPFFVMELVRGSPITEYCDEHQLTIRQRIELFIPVCHAVQHAHQKGILHRDLKPSNILITEIDGHPVPKVIDFGIAKALGTSPEALSPESLLQTQAGAVIGTPQYMSPEQAGAAPDLDTRSDIYTLGIILFELLTGDTPLSRDSLRKAALDEILRLVREADPRRPSSRVIPVTDPVRKTATSRQTEPARLARALSGDLDWITLKALEKERDRRYGSAAALAQDLERHLKNEPVEAGPPSPVYRLRKLVRRNRLAFAAAAAIAVSLLAGIFVSTWQWQRAEKQKESQEQLLWNASHSEHEAAMDAFESGQKAEGIAHLVRALEYRPMNYAARAASAAHAFAGYGNRWCARSITSFDGPVYCLAFSPDGDQLAAGGKDGTLRVIETATGKEIRKLKFLNSVDFVSYSPDGRHMVTGGAITVQVTEAATGREVSAFILDDLVSSISNSPDSRLIAVGCSNGTARIIDANSAKMIRKIEFGGEDILVAFSPISELLAVASDLSSEKGEVRFYQPSSGREIGRAEFNHGADSISFSPDGRFLAVGWADLLQVIETATGKQTSIIKLRMSGNEVVFSPDGMLIATGGLDETLHVIEAASGKEVSKLPFGRRVTSICFSPDGRFVAAGSEDATLRVIEVATGALVSSAMFGGRINCVRFSDDGCHLAACSDDSTVRLFDLASTWELIVGGHDMSFTSDGRLLCLKEGFEARVLDVLTGKEISNFRLSDEDHDVLFSPDGRLIAFKNRTTENKIRIVAATTGKEVGRAEFGGKVTSMKFSPDGRFVAVRSDDKTVSVIEVLTGKEISRSKSGDAYPRVNFSPDGRFITVGDETDQRGLGKLLIIEAATGKEHRRHDRESVFGGQRFSPDSHFIGSDSTYRAFQVLDVMSGKTVSNAELDHGLWSWSFSPDGRYIAAGTDYKSIYVIEAETGKITSKTTSKGSSSTIIETVSFNHDGSFYVAGTEKHLSLQETITGKPVARVRLAGIASLEVAFSRAHDLLAVHSSPNILLDCRWMNRDEEMASPWVAALRLQSGHQFHPDGRLVAISASEMLGLQDAVTRFIGSPSTAATARQHAILKWSRMPPETRTTSPWTTEPLRTAAGRWMMSYHEEAADLVPWHPLAPLTQAEQEPMPDDDDWDPVHGMLRPTFLARLTLKRLRAADEKLYGRETLAEYAEWAADTMSETWNLYSEALEAIDFALERTPKEKQQSLLDMKKEVQASISKSANPAATPKQ